jgi:hypothetical protein
MDQVSNFHPLFLLAMATFGSILLVTWLDRSAER